MSPAHHQRRAGSVPQTISAAAALLRSARFHSAATAVDHLPPAEGWEVAFLGRSNAGKSSAFNTLTEQRSLARVSRTPGRTRQINFFQVANGALLADMPGYGYAEVGAAIQRMWAPLSEGYIQSRETLAGLVLVMDCRHPLQRSDQQLWEWLDCRPQLPRLVLLTKSDKLNRHLARQALLKVQKLWAGAQIMLFSSLNGEGAPQAQALIAQWLQGGNLSLPA